MKINKLFIVVASMAVLLVGCNRVDEGDTNFDNVVYIENAKNKSTERLTFKPKDISATRVLNASLAEPAGHDINIKFKVDPSLVGKYSQANYIECELLPEEYYELVDDQAVIRANSVLSTDVEVMFKNIQDMPRNTTYLLPLTIESATDIDILNASKTLYYVVSKGATINTAVYMANNYFTIPNFDSDKGSDVVRNMSEVTFEFLMMPKQWKSISSIMGVEEYFLIRIGDTMPENQAQLAYGDNSGGPRLTEGVWQHVAMTFNTSTKRLIWYVDGVQTNSTTISSYNYGPVDLNKNRAVSGKENGFYIGFSFDPSRYFDGFMSEVRIWNVVRTQEEIAENMYEVEANSEGLVAYWKLDDGTGDQIKDYTKNGNHGKSKNTVVWTPVGLPAEN